MILVEENKRDAFMKDYDVFKGIEGVSDPKITQRHRGGK